MKMNRQFFMYLLTVFAVLVLTFGYVYWGDIFGQKTPIDSAHNLSSEEGTISAIKEEIINKEAVQDIAVEDAVVQPATDTKGDPVLGKQNAQLCSGCHGMDGNSVNQNIPKLAGQLEDYIVLAATEFQQGIRKDPTMSAMAPLIGDVKNLMDIAAYFSSQPKMQGLGGANNDTSKGAALFTSERCNYCHGDEGKRYAPFQDNIPPIIGGQHKPYLIKAMKDIRDSKRPGDIYGLMPRLIGELSDAQIDAIAEYLSQLK